MATSRAVLGMRRSISIKSRPSTIGVNLPSRTPPRPGNFCRSCYIPLSSSRRKLFMLDKIAARAQKASSYTELRWHGNFNVQMSMRKGALITNTRSQSRGLSARIYRNQGFGFAALPGDDDDTVTAVLAQAADKVPIRSSRRQALRFPQDRALSERAASVVNGSFVVAGFESLQAVRDPIQQSYYDDAWSSNRK